MQLYRAEPSRERRFFIAVADRERMLARGKGHHHQVACARLARSLSRGADYSHLADSVFKAEGYLRKGTCAPPVSGEGYSF